ncbi:MAG: sulfotransferase [Planctomycetes bacterium]|nr:sulfotransferase [Planctomycetota bacterium]
MSLRLAMWSGPRNISTAMMRSFDTRPDSFVSDEPLYSAYLQITGLPHPMTEEIIATHDPNWESVVQYLTGPIPNGANLWYQKHMSHHLLPEMDRDWLDQLTNAFLIREPRAMLVSLIDRLGPVGIQDTGLPQQLELFYDQRERTGKIPVVVDSQDVLRNPEGILRQLCENIGITFKTTMLSWESGPRATDGCWGPHWYHSTNNSTGFTPYRAKEVEVLDEFEHIAQECEAIYKELHAYRIR